MPGAGSFSRRGLLAGAFGLATGKAFALSPAIRSIVLGGASSPEWTPASLGGKLLAWYDETSLVASGGKVAQWTDLSGLGQHLAWADAARQPLYVATGFNGIPCAKFTQTAGYLQRSGFKMGGAAVGIFAAAKEYYDILVPRRLASFTAAGDPDDATNVSSASFLFTSGAGPGSLRTYRAGSSVDYLDDLGDGILEFCDRPSRISVVYDGVLATLYNGNAARGSVASSGSFGASGTFAVGGRAPDAVGDVYWSGPVARMLVVKDTTADERALIDQWLARPGPTTNRILVTEGDSIAYTGEEFGGFTYAFVSHAIPTVFLNNVAIAGSRLATNPGDLIYRTANVDGLLPARRDGRLHIFFVFIGHNDTPADADQAAWIDTLIAYCKGRQLSGFSRIVVATVLPRSDAAFAAHNGNRALLNPRIRTACAANGFVVCDFAADPIMGLDATSDDLTYYQSDKVHPNAAGHARLEPIFRGAINAL